MTPSKPYILRGLYQWIVDNQVTPHILVDVSYEGVQIPVEHVDENNQITLNISPLACQGLTLGDVSIEFSARFSGRAMEIIVPTAAVLAIYARENGQGMVFGQEPGHDAPPPNDGGDNDDTPPPPTEKKGGHLKLVK